MVKCESKNGHQKDMCLKEIGLYAQKYANYRTRLISQHDLGGGGYMTTYWAQEYSFW